MPAPDSRDETTLHLDADLDAATVLEAHAGLVALLRSAEGHGGAARVALDTGSGDLSPLSTQLLVSAVRSFPAERLTLGPHAAAALAALEHPKEIS